MDEIFFTDAYRVVDKPNDKNEKEKYKMNKELELMAYQWWKQLQGKPFNKKFKLTNMPKAKVHKEKYAHQDIEPARIVFLGGTYYKEKTNGDGVVYSKQAILESYNRKWKECKYNVKSNKAQAAL